MELEQKEKDRIIAEEKLRMETRKEFMKENLEGWRGHRMGGCWPGHGGCCRGGGILKAVVLVAVLGAMFHCWRGDSCRPCGYYPATGQTQAAPAVAPQAPGKN